MIKELERLSGSEVDMLAKAPMLVCILIAGADNEIDNKEIKSAIELAKKSKAKASVAEFFRTASQDFEDKLKIILQSLPTDGEKRTAVVAEELSQLNSVFAQLETNFANDFYETLIYIARKIAESSGGVLGMNKVGDEEMRFISLPMLNPPLSK